MVSFSLLDKHIRICQITSRDHELLQAQSSIAIAVGNDRRTQKNAQMIFHSITSRILHVKALKGQSNSSQCD